MQSGRIAFLLALFLPTAAHSTGDSRPYTGCVSGHRTFLVNACATGWSGAPLPGTKSKSSAASDETYGAYGTFYEDDLNAFNPWDSERAENSARRLKLNYAECPALNVLEVRLSDHMAKVHCEGRKSAEAWINLDALTCTLPPPRYVAPAVVQSGCPPISSAPLSDAATDMAHSMVDALDESPTNQILVEAKQRAIQTQKLAQQDHDTLLKMYGPGMTASSDLYHRLEQARKTAHAQYTAASKAFGPNCDLYPANFNHADADRGQRTCRLVRATYRMSDYYIKRAEATAVPGISKEDRENVIGLSLRLAWMEHYGNPIEISENPLMAEAENDRKAGGGPVADYRSLVFRQMLFEGLPKEQRQEALDKNSKHHLNFFRTSAEVDGKPVELHNGYVFGGSRLSEAGGGRDCSDFLSAILTGWTGDMLSTDKMRDIALYLGHAPGAPRKADTKWNGFDRCFDPVNLRSGEPLLSGDIVISRNDTIAKGGHVVVVESVDRTKGTIRTVEAGGVKFNTVGSTTRPLYEPSCGPSPSGVGSNAVVRPDLVALRFHKKEGCNIDILKRSAGERDGLAAK